MGSYTGCVDHQGNQLTDGPAAPTGPVGPTTPFSPLGPLAPLSPLAPGCPAAPCGEQTVAAWYSDSFYLHCFQIDLHYVILTAGPANPLGPAGPTSPRSPWVKEWVQNTLATRSP